MQLSANQVFRAVTPYGVVSALKLPLKERAGLFFTPHPRYPQHEFQIEPDEFVGVRYDSPTPACNVFDFLALHFGGYERAVDFAIREFYHLAVLPPNETLASVRDQIVQNLKDERQQFEQILAFGQPLRTYDPGLTQAFIYCRHLGVEPHLAACMFYVVRGEALNKVLPYANHSVRPLKPNDLFWVYPYFKDRRTVGLLEIENASRKLVRTVRLNPARYLYFGLHSEFADSEQTRVLATRQETLEAYGYALKTGRFRIGFLHVRCDLKAESTPPRKRAIFLVTEAAGFDAVASMRHASSGLILLPVRTDSPKR